MRSLILLALVTVLAVLPGCGGGDKLKGSISGRRYVAPGGAFSVALTTPGPPEDIVDDEVRGDAIMMRQREVYGGVNRVEAQRLSDDEIAQIRGAGAARALQTHFDEAVLPALTQATGGRGEVLERRAVDARTAGSGGSGGEAYYVLVRFPQMGETDSTGEAKDHYRGYLLQLREPYLFLVTRSRNLHGSLWNASAASELYVQTISFARGIEVGR